MRVRYQNSSLTISQFRIMSTKKVRAVLPVKFSTALRGEGTETAGSYLETRCYSYVGPTAEDVRDLKMPTTSWKAKIEFFEFLWENGLPEKQLRDRGLIQPEVWHALCFGAKWSPLRELDHQQRFLFCHEPLLLTRPHMHWAGYVTVLSSAMLGFVPKDFQWENGILLAGVRR